MILHPTKTKSMLLATGQKISFTRFTLILVLKTVTLKEFKNTSTLVLVLIMNLTGDHILLAHVKQLK